MDLAELARAIFALALTLGLVGLGAVGLRKLGPDWLSRLQPGGKAKRRLAILETLVLDPHRRLVLVRCDGEERLVLLGEGKVLMTPVSPAEPVPAESSDSSPLETAA
ncbi:MAG TPA: flagellar biosynthetic protein FliO [Caulobacteraceae bacterium]